MDFPHPEHDALSSAAEEHGIRQFLTFLLQGEMYAVAISHVKEIIEYTTITHVPLIPGFIRGVINLRGAVLPVIDLSARFHESPTTLHPRSCIVILELHNGDRPLDMGVLVDAVRDVVDLEKNAIEPPPQFGSHIRSDFIQAMGSIAGQFVIILDIPKVLSLDDIAELVALQVGDALRNGTSLHADNHPKNGQTL